MKLLLRCGRGRSDYPHIIKRYQIFDRAMNVVCQMNLKNGRECFVMPDHSNTRIGYNAEGEKQLMGYLDYWNLNTGYLLSFNLNKKKEPGVERVQIGDKVLYEGTV